MRVLVTGSSGFVGRALCLWLSERGHEVVGHVRRPGSAPASCIAEIACDIGDTPVLEQAMSNHAITGVVHLAGIAHVLDESGDSLVSEYFRVNRDATLRLARSAARVGCARFVFVSSVKVHGEPPQGRPLVEDDDLAASDAYGRSKAEAEASLFALGEKTGLSVCVLRPPLVYGPGVKANFLRLLRLVSQRGPLPLSLVKNQRSMLFVGNFCDAITSVLENDAAGGKAFLVADKDALATSELVRMMGQCLRTRAVLFPVPVVFMRFVASLLGRERDVNRLVSSLWVDSERIKKELGWMPPFTVRQGVERTVDWFVENKTKLDG